MDRREFLGALAGGLVAAQAAEAQQPGKVYHIGMLERTSAAINAANLDGFRQGLRDLGYVEEGTWSSNTDQPMATTNDSLPSLLIWPG